MEGFEFLDKWPNWLRWVLFLPLSFVVSFFVRAISVIGYGMMSGSSFSIISQTIFTGAEVFGFLMGVYIIVPKKKNIFLIILSSILISFYGGFIFVNISRENIWNADNLGNLIAIIVAIVMICIFNKDIFETSSIDQVAVTNEDNDISDEEFDKYLAEHDDDEDLL